MALVHGAELVAVIQEGGESAKTLDRPGMQRVLAMVERRQVQAVIVAKLDRLTRSVRDLCELLELLERRGVALISVAESLDTGSAAGRLVINIMAAVSQWEREAIGERTRDALRHGGARASAWAISLSGTDSAQTANMWSRILASKRCWRKFADFAVRGCHCGGSLQR